MEDALAADKRIFGPENEFVVNDLFGLSQIQRRTNPREAEKIAPGSEGLYFLPYLAGERTPHADPDAAGGRS